MRITHPLWTIPIHSLPSDSLFKCTIEIWFVVILIPRPGDAEPVGGYVANELTVRQRIHWVQVIRTLAVNSTMQIPRFGRDVVEESIGLARGKFKIAIDSCCGGDFVGKHDILPRTSNLQVYWGSGEKTIQGLERVV